MNQKYAYVAIRMVELLCAAAFVFGLMWQGVDSFSLKTSQFLILYGLIGGCVCEVASRALNKTAKFRDAPKRQK